MLFNKTKNKKKSQPSRYTYKRMNQIQLKDDIELQEIIKDEKAIRK